MIHCNSLFRCENQASSFASAISGFPLEFIPMNIGAGMTTLRNSPKGGFFI